MLSKNKYMVFLASYAHIDSEWLWSIDETRSICISTIEKVLKLMKKYPQLKFIQSSLICIDLLKGIKQEIIQDVRKAVDEGRWDASGTYVEFDANMSSGESILRQFLYGAKLANEIGIKPTTLFLADSFGFPSTIPKLMKNSGLRYFVTSKLNWNDTNEYPYNLFWWKSSDGSKVLAYLTPGNYNDYLSSIKRVIWNIYRQLTRQNMPLILQLYGRGDHGGGPGEDELANIVKWLNKYKPILTFTASTISEFLQHIETTRGDKLPEYNGELYLEFHRGAYTTGVLAKKLNRVNEVLVLEAEKLYTILNVIYGARFPQQEFNDIWRKILLNQGHDALPATVPLEVYEGIVHRGLDVFRNLLRVVKQGLSLILSIEGGKYIIYNPNSWPTSVYIVTRGENVDGYFQELIDGSRLIYVKDLPPLGFKLTNTLGEKPCDEAVVVEKDKYYILENKYLKVLVSKKTGWILSILDKKFKRSLLEAPIRLRLLWDYPLTLRGKAALASMFDAWEVFYLDSINKFSWRDLKAVDHEVVARGPLYASVNFKYTIKQLFHGESIVELEIGIYADKPFLEIKFRTYWRALHRLLKLIIPLKLNSDEALFEEPYGVIKRKDSCRSSSPVDKAKYEVPALRWVDVSDGEYGVAVITDSRHGFSFCNRTLSVSLIRAPLQPNRKLIVKSIEETPMIQRCLKDVSIMYASKLKRYGLMLGLLIATIVLNTLNFSKLRPIDHGFHTARIWIYPHRGNYVDGKVHSIASELNSYYFIVKNWGINREKTFSFLNVEPHDKVHVAALKKCENEEDCLMIRLYNVTELNIVAKLLFNFNVYKAYRASHLETPIQELPIMNERELIVNLSPMAVETILLKLKS
ncbi:MAG: glycoside hydrolase family 38 C-terminal domain-containing protein [Desulfurococcaceae archaeon]